MPWAVLASGAGDCTLSLYFEKNMTNRPYNAFFFIKFKKGDGWEEIMIGSVNHMDFLCVVYKPSKLCSYLVKSHFSVTSV